MLSIKNIYSLFIIFFFYQANAQHNLKLVVQNLSATHLNDTVYVAGNFNGWNPGKTAMAFQQDKNVWEIILSLPTDQYEFKFTLGSWDNVQVTKSGKDAANNSMKLLNDTSIFFTIVAWKNEFEVLPKKHTASNHVTIMDTAFNIPQLNSKRKIWVYLPRDYENNNKRYPVLYMHDGQNLFDEYTGNFGEWGVDEALDSLIKTGAPACIVVGINNGPNRINEYNPYNTDRFGKGEGDNYLQFIVNNLKPYIDKHYKTLSQKENTIIAGSSMGGLISYYAVAKYPSVFGKAGVFSPSFWIAPQMDSLTQAVAPSLSGKYFFYMGGKESEEAIPDMFNINTHRNRP
jgi:alpha-glucosidase